MKALVGAFNQEKALVGAFSVIVQPVVEPMDRFAALTIEFICYLLCPPPSHVTHDRLDNLAELAVLEAVEDEVEAAVEDDQEVRHRHRDLHEVAPQRLLGV